MVPLSFAQRRLWFIDEFDGPSATYNVPFLVRLEGELDTGVLAEALNDLVRRHESLRTLIVADADGVPSQRVLSMEQARLGLPVVEVAADEVDQAVADAAGYAIDLSTELPVRAVLLRKGRTDHVLVLLIHHIASDGESMHPLARDLGEAYAARLRGEAPGWPDLPVQYADYTLWQREMLGSESDPDSVLSVQSRFWRTELADLAQPMRLPVDKPRPPVASRRGDIVEFPLDPELLAVAERLASERRLTVPMVLQTALAVTLMHSGAGTDIAMGSTIAGRTEEQLADLVGFFVNTWVLRVDFSGGPTFAEVLDQVGERAYRAYENQDAPFERLVELLNPRRSTAYHPLFQVMFTWENDAWIDLDWPGGTARMEVLSTSTAKFDLEFSFFRKPGRPGMLGYLEYAVDLFDRATAEALAERFTRVLWLLLAEPARAVAAVDVLTPAELGRVLGEFALPGVAGAEGAVPELVRAVVAVHPDAVAVESAAGTLTYRELDARSDLVATALLDRGLGREDLVGLAVPRTAELVVAVLGVLKSGAAYVPVDPAYPSARLTAVLDEARPAVVLTDSATAPTLPVADLPLVLVDRDLPASPGPVGRRPPLPGNTAYVMYTSGSTGVPKGVAITHRGVVNGVLRLAEVVGITTGTRVLAGTSVNFDVSVFEIVATLAAGGRVEVVRDVLQLLERGGWTGGVVSAVPSVLCEVVSKLGSELRAETVVLAGEALSADLVTRVRAAVPGVRVINAYGQTESFYATTAEVTGTVPGASVPVGSPLGGMRTYVLGQGLRPVPVGVVGELYVAGEIGRGYQDRAVFTAEQFVADLFGEPGARMYRTGDLARWDTSGRLHYEGRADSQLKISGVRVEPSEVEAAILAHPGVTTAAVVAHEVPGRSARLVGYVVPVGAQDSGFGDVDSLGDLEVDLTTTLSVRDLRGFVARRLPEYLVPATFVLLGALPLTPNGKLDRSALPEPEFGAERYRAPAEGRERVLAGLYAEVLGLDRVGADEDFFAIGGDSIRSIQVAARAKAYGLEVSPRQVFDHRTVAELAVAARETTAAEPALAELAGAGVGWLPLMPIAEQVFGLGGGTDRFSMSVVVDLPDGIDAAGLAATLSAVLDHHDALRSRLVEDGVLISVPGTVKAAGLIHRVPWSSGWDEAWRAEAAAQLDAATGALDAARGDVVRAVWFDRDGAPGRLILVLDHLVVDGVSWRVLLPDLAQAWRAVSLGEPPALAPVGTSVRRWAHALRDEALSLARARELAHWRETLAAPEPALGSRRLDPAVDVVSTVEHTWLRLGPAETEAVLGTVPASAHAAVNDVLLTALALAVAKVRGGASLRVRLEGHGREDQVVPGADLSRTVGWFTSTYPVLLDLTGIDVEAAGTGGPAAGAALKAVKEQLLATPDHGIGYGLLRYLNPKMAAVLGALPEPEIGFNYLGRYSAADMPERLRGLGWTRAQDAVDLVAEPDPDLPALAALDIVTLITDSAEGPVLVARFSNAPGAIATERAAELGRAWQDAVRALIRYAGTPGAGGRTPSDLALVTVGQQQIEEWERAFPALADVWPLTPMQSGLLFHAQLAGTDFDAYQMRLVFHLEGPVDTERMRAAGQALLTRYPNLAVAFSSTVDGDRVQVLTEGVRLPWYHEDLRGMAHERQQARLARFLDEDHATHFDPAVGPLARLSLLTTADTHAELVLTAHHVLFDGWSVPLLMRDLLRLYATGGDDSTLARPRGYRDFLVWMSRQDRAAALAAWRAELSGVTEPTILVPHEAAVSTGVGQRDVPLSAGTARAVAERAKQLGLTMGTVVQCAWAVVLAHLTGRTDVLFGAAVSGRPPAVDGIDEMVGMFINTLPVRVDCGSAVPLAELMAATQRRQAALLDHHHLGLLDIHRATGFDTLFDTIVGFESYPIDGVAIAEANADAGISITGVSPLSGAHYPLVVMAFAEPHLRLGVQYWTS